MTSQTCLPRTLTARVSSFVTWLQPRDARLTGPTTAPLCIVAAGVTTFVSVTSLLQSKSDVLTTAITVVASILIVAGGWATRYLTESHRLLWAALPFLAIAAIVGLDLFSHDSSVTAQIFFVFPALYASSCLPKAGVVVVTLAAVAGEATAVFTLLSFDDAVLDFGSVTAVLVTAVAFLTRSAEQQQTLIALLRRQAAVDPLTGLVTRRVLDQAAESALSGAASTAGTALIMLDVDNFKGVNDRYGHPAGDAVLVHLGHLLLRSCRPSDVVSRMGGDEIALLLPGCSYDALIRRAAAIVADVHGQAFPVEGRQIKVTVSAGLAHAPTDASDLRSLYVAADAALYRAKRAGGDQLGLPEAPLNGRSRGGATPVGSGAVAHVESES